VRTAVVVQKNIFFGGRGARPGCFKKSYPTAKPPMQCNAMQCNAMQCNAMQCNAMQCNAMLDIPFFKKII
jgi:hypothetical protein